MSSALNVGKYRRIKTNGHFTYACTYSALVHYNVPFHTTGKTNIPCEIFSMFAKYYKNELRVKGQ